MSRMSSRSTSNALLSQGLAELGANLLAPYNSVDKYEPSARDHDSENEFENGKPFLFPYVFLDQLV